MMWPMNWSIPDFIDTPFHVYHLEMDERVVFMMTYMEPAKDSFVWQNCFLLARSFKRQCSLNSMDLMSYCDKVSLFTLEVVTWCTWTHHSFSWIAVWDLSNVELITTCVKVYFILLMQQHLRNLTILIKRYVSYKSEMKYTAR